MRKIILIGRSECGKTTLTQALKGDVITYHKTQYINHYDVVIDTPGEYAETVNLGRALALYSFEADVTGLLLSSIEPYSLYPPCCAACFLRQSSMRRSGRPMNLIPREKQRPNSISS